MALGPEHLSCYILTVDERVPMGRDVARGRLFLPSDDDVAEQYLATGGGSPGRLRAVRDLELGEAGPSVST